jgi:hypothetical protein
VSHGRKWLASAPDPLLRLHHVLNDFNIFLLHFPTTFVHGCLEFPTQLGSDGCCGRFRRSPPGLPEGHCLGGEGLHAYSTVSCISNGLACRW